MKQTALYTAAVIFVLVSLAHWLRFFLGAEIIIGGTAISQGLSVVAGLVSAALAVWMVMAARKP
ncbi:MAG: hypothetical protein ISR48_02970 [Alphaproteobacteria bacterium]|nr:hypothetical protein [Alphaproteobacteria bacterium]